MYMYVFFSYTSTQAEALKRANRDRNPKEITEE